VSQPAGIGPVPGTARPNLGEVGYSDLSSWEGGLDAPKAQIVAGDARDTGLEANSVDVVATSPPYWQKRDYGHPDQIGQEPTPEGFVSSIMDCLTEWQRVLRPTGSIFLNVGDTYFKRSLIGIPGRIEAAAVDSGWSIRNRIIWAKTGGMPEPARNRLAVRHEYVIHLTYKPTYYYDLAGYQQYLGVSANPGDVWSIEPERDMSAHLAPFPSEIVRRVIALACPPQVCTTCGMPRKRVEERTDQLDPSRPQARRAMELAQQHRLTPAHIRAIQATGVSDVGKATKFQNGTGRNSQEVQHLAAEAKAALGGYFREFTFAKRTTVGWTDCGHGTPSRGVVLDPFVGTGTTVRVANDMTRHGIGVDLNPIPGKSLTGLS